MAVDVTDVACFHTTATQVILQHLISHLLAFVGCIVFEAKGWNETLALHSAWSSSERLLVGMSDAVVHLTDNKTVFKRAPALAALLSLPCDSSSLVGTSFMDLVATTDRQRVKDFMHVRPADTDYFELPVQSLPVQLCRWCKSCEH